VLRLHVSRLVETRNLTCELPISLMEVLRSAAHESTDGTHKLSDEFARATSPARRLSQNPSYEIDAIRAKQIGR
jgi:hypothetical protein